MKFHYHIVVITLSCCSFFFSGHAYSSEGIGTDVKATSVGKREYGNILIVWEPSTVDVSVNVTITMGTALIGAMHFTPDTLKQSLNYSNSPQAATGIFIIEFNATGKGGKLYVENLKWETKSNKGDVTSLIGIWSLNK